MAQTTSKKSKGAKGMPAGKRGFLKTYDELRRLLCKRSVQLTNVVTTRYKADAVGGGKVWVYRTIVEYCVAGHLLPDDEKESNDVAPLQT